LRGNKTGIQINRSDNRLDGIGKNGMRWRSA
jgi:hypothetical protein